MATIRLNIFHDGRDISDEVKLMKSLHYYVFQWVQNVNGAEIIENIGTGAYGHNLFRDGFTCTETEE
jgi:hypothetical protein